MFEVTKNSLFGCRYISKQLLQTQTTRNSPFPKKNLVPFGFENLLLDLCNCLESIEGPQKNTPTSVSGCCCAIEEKTRSQFGRPKCVGAFKLVMASFSAPTSCTMILFMSSSLIFAVRYMLISILFWVSCSSMACKRE